MYINCIIVYYFLLLPCASTPHKKKKKLSNKCSNKMARCDCKSKIAIINNIRIVRVLRLNYSLRYYDTSPATKTNKKTIRENKKIITDKRCAQKTIFKQ